MPLQLLQGTSAKDTISNTEHGFDFSLPVCRRTSLNGLSCELSVTSTNQDAELSLYNEYRGELAARLWDDSNNVYAAKWVSLANRSTSGRSEVRIALVSGVPAKIVIKFENVAHQISRISKLDLGCWSNEPFHVALKDISLLQ